jgi:outer membrane protein TolC
LSIPIFDQGRRRSEITLRKLDQQQAAIAYQQTVLKAWHEIDTALASYSAQAQRNAQLVQREMNSRVAYELAHVRYENGLTTFLDDLDAQRTLLQAQRDRVMSDSQLAIQLVSIYKAIGGDAIEPATASP